MIANKLEAAKRYMAKKEAFYKHRIELLENIIEVIQERDQELWKEELELLVYYRDKQKKRALN